MPLTSYKLAVALGMVLALVGCKTPPAKTSSTTGELGASQKVMHHNAHAAKVEFYVAQAKAAPGLVEVKLPEGKLYMHKKPVLTRKDLTEAAALADRDGKNFVGLRFSEAGARKLNEISRNNMGKMLALVINRELVAAPTLGEPLDKGVLAFGVPSAEMAANIAAKIRGDETASTTKPRVHKVPSPAY